MDNFIFNSPLTEGIIQNRKSQFTMLADVGSKICSLYSPKTGGVGNIKL